MCSLLFIFAIVLRLQLKPPVDLYIDVSTIIIYPEISVD